MRDLLGRSRSLARRGEWGSPSPGWSTSTGLAHARPARPWRSTSGARWSGSVSGGCVEGAVVTEALEVLAHRRTQGRDLRLQRRRRLRGWPDLRRHDPPLPGDARLVTALYDRLATAVRHEEPVVLATVIDGPGAGAKLLVQPGETAVGSLGDADLDRVVARDALGELAAGTTVGAPLRRARRGPRGGRGGVRRVLRPTAPHAGLRCRRLHRRAGPGGQGARLPGHGVRRPRGVRHPGPLPAGRRGGGRLAGPAARAGRPDARAP